MTNSWRKLIVATLVCYAVGFLVILLTSVLGFTLEETLADFQWQWIMAETWSEFLSLAPVAQAWAVVITFSLVIPMRSSGLTGTSFERFGSSIIVLLLMTLVFSLAYGLAHPRVVSNRSNLEFSSSFARSLWNSAQQAIDDQNYQRALSDLDQYLGIVGDSEEAQELMRQVGRDVQLDFAGHLDGDEVATTEVPERDRAAGVEELIDRARAAHEAEDFSTAHYMATLALALDQESDEAARLAAEALERLAENAPGDEESAQSALFRQKQAALEALQRGDVIDAYYRFKELERERPADVDVARYLALAAARVEDLTLFKDDVERALAMPGTGGFAFVNRSDEFMREVVAIGKLVRAPVGLYAQSIEVMRFTLDGRPEYHLSSDYGKYVDGSLVLTVLDPDNPNTIVRPTIHHGSHDPETENLLVLTPSADDLWLLGVASADPAGASVTDLVRTAGSLQSFGIVSEPIEAEMLFRLSLPFTYLILNILVLGFSWRYRSRYLSRPPLGAFVIVPLAPLVLLPLYLLLRYFHRVLFSALLLWTNLPLAIGLLIAVEAVVLAVSLMYLALSSRE